MYVVDVSQDIVDYLTKKNLSIMEEFKELFHFQILICIHSWMMLWHNAIVHSKGQYLLTYKKINFYIFSLLGFWLKVVR